MVATQIDFSLGQALLRLKAYAFASAKREVVPLVVDLEVAVPRSRPAVW